MLNVISKQVTAIGITPRINDVDRDRIQEWLDGTHPMSSARKVYDTGTKRKTVLDQSPAGPAEITENPDERSSHKNVGSGYSEGPNPGGRADDETGPGNNSDPDPEQDFQDGSAVELAFLSEGDTSSKWSPLNYESNARDQKAVTHLMRLHQRPGVGALPNRHNVDELVRRNRAASSNWFHKYV